MSKDNHLFAPASRIAYLMEVLERDILVKYTPCSFTNLDELAYTLGLVHVELILIHPFREGNGRIARLLAGLMSAQANGPPLNFQSIDKTQNPKGFDSYISAIQEGMLRRYEPIQEVFKMILSQPII